MTVRLQKDVEKYKVQIYWIMSLLIGKVGIGMKWA